MEKRNFEHEARQIILITVHGKSHVIRVVNRENKRDIPEPDYLHTGQALVGILGNNETLEQFRANWVKKENLRN